MLQISCELSSQFVTPLNSYHISYKSNSVKPFFYYFLTTLSPKDNEKK